MREGDSVYTENMDPELIELRKKDKILKMIKNSHIEKLKNAIYLKEINNAYYEMVRLGQSGDFAESKEMERTLNNLHASLIQSNIDAFSQTKMARTHADFGKTVGSTFYKGSMNQNYRTQKDDNIKRLYNSTTTTTKKVINRDIEEDEIEEKENEEEEERRIKKSKKNKNKIKKLR